MANNIIMRQIVLTGSVQPLGGDEVFTVDVSCPPGNTAPVYFQARGGEEVPWVSGQWHHLEHMKLSDVTVRGAVGDKVCIIGGTW